jgi:hypothetical protein
MPMQQTPLRGPKIVAILKAGIGPNVFRSIGGGAADGQAVRLQPSAFSHPAILFRLPASLLTKVLQYRRQ